MSGLDTYITSMTKCGGMGCIKKSNCLRYEISAKINYFKYGNCDLYFPMNAEKNINDTLNNLKNIFGM